MLYFSILLCDSEFAVSFDKTVVNAENNIRKIEIFVFSVRVH